MAYFWISELIYSKASLECHGPCDSGTPIAQIEENRMPVKINILYTHQLPSCSVVLRAIVRILTQRILL